MDYIICDIDGTVADASHRIPYIQTKPKHRKMGEAWFGEDYFSSGANNERRLLVLAFCITMTEQP